MSVSLDSTPPVSASPTVSPSTPPVASGKPTITIFPHKGWQAIRIAEVWQNRDLLLLMCLRDVTVRYKQALLGILWAIIQPLTQMVVMNLIFGRFGGMSARVKETVGFDVPYPIFLFSGLISWQFFNSAVNAGSNSLLNNANMLRKIYVPRLILPLASQGAPMADYSLSMLVLFGMMIYYKMTFSVALLLLPLLVLSTILASLSVGMLLSALSVRYRDFKFVIPFFLQVWFYLTPVIYPIKMFPDQYRWVLKLNPMAGPVEGFRAIVLGTPVPWTSWGISLGVTAVLLALGLTYFSRVERQFADLI